MLIHRNGVEDEEDQFGEWGSVDWAAELKEQ